MFLDAYYSPLASLEIGIGNIKKYAFGKKHMIASIEIYFGKPYIDAGSCFVKLCLNDQSKLVAYLDGFDNCGVEFLYRVWE